MEHALKKKKKLGLQLLLIDFSFENYLPNYFCIQLSKKKKKKIAEFFTK